MTLILKFIILIIAIFIIFFIMGSSFFGTVMLYKILNIKRNKDKLDGIGINSNLFLDIQQKLDDNIFNKDLKATLLQCYNNVIIQVDINQELYEIIIKTKSEIELIHFNYNSLYFEIKNPIPEIAIEQINNSLINFNNDLPRLIDDLEINKNIKDKIVEDFMS